MTEPLPPALDFLLTRRSRPAKLLAEPVPDREAMALMLRAAMRVPDHGKLEPWRFLVLTRPALDRLAALAGDCAAAQDMDADRAEKGRSQFAQSPLAVAVVASPRASDRIPAVEQTLSAGAACLSLLNAALAAGWGASWLTGWPAYDRTFVEQGLGLAPQEWIAGFIHIGTAQAIPADRPRPDPAERVRWIES